MCGQCLILPWPMLQWACPRGPVPHYVVSNWARGGLTLWTQYTPKKADNPSSSAPRAVEAKAALFFCSRSSARSCGPCSNPQDAETASGFAMLLPGGPHVRTPGIRRGPQGQLSGSVPWLSPDVPKGLVGGPHGVRGAGERCFAVLWASLSQRVLRGHGEGPDFWPEVRVTACGTASSIGLASLPRP